MMQFISLEDFLFESSKKTHLDVLAELKKKMEDEENAKNANTPRRKIELNRDKAPTPISEPIKRVRNYDEMPDPFNKRGNNIDNQFNDIQPSQRYETGRRFQQDNPEMERLRNFYDIKYRGKLEHLAGLRDEYATKYLANQSGNSYNPEIETKLKQIDNSIVNLLQMISANNISLRIFKQDLPRTMDKLNLYSNEYKDYYVSKENYMRM